MNRPLLNRVFPQVLVWTAVVALSAMIAIAQSAPQAGSQRSDGQIEMDVVHALDASKALKDDLITAATIQSEVTLSGTVASEASRELAESIAGRVPGVTAVHNNLKVGNPQDAQAETPADPGEDQTAADEQNNEPMPQEQGPPQQAPGQGQSQDQGQYQPYPPPPPSRPQYGAPQPQYGSQQPQYGSQQPQYETMPPPQQTYAAPRGPVTIPAATLLQVRTNEPVGSKRAQNGTPVQFTVIQDVAFGGVLAIPRGATVHGVVTESKRAGELGGSAFLALTLTSMDLGGQTYPLETDQFRVKGPNKAGQTAGNVVGGAILGAIIGGAVGRGPGAAIGAAAGAGAGTAASAASSGPGVWIPAEARVDFHLAAPLTVAPVSRQEASRLAQGLYQGGPSLYRRAGPAYGPRYYGRPYGYGYPYPPVYYRPYFITGGFYYWR